MKKLSLSLITVFLLLTIIPTQLDARSKTNPESNKTAEAAEATVLLKRLDEIKNMDMSTLSKSEKKELRNEVRETKKTLRTNSSGIYFSAAALIIIILLLILLL